jgi:glycerophosphoryl diester phosphodiesterase
MGALRHRGNVQACAGPGLAVLAGCAGLGLAVLAGCAGAFDLQGHRGARGLAPENTLAAFRRALAIGVTTLETDLAATRDDVLVISHNATLNHDIVRDPDGRWLAADGPPIRTLTSDELRRYDIGRIDPSSRYARQFPEQRSADGERFPTLVELFALVNAHPSPVRLNIETKIDPTRPADTVDPATFARLVVDAVRGAHMEARVTVQSFDWRTLVEVKKLAPSIPTACLTMETTDHDTVKPSAYGPSAWTAGLDLRNYANSVPALARAAGCTTWSPLASNVTAAKVREAHDLGLQVLPWTVNDPAVMARLIDQGVDGLITDYPDRLRNVMADKGLTLP